MDEELVHKELLKWAVFQQKTLSEKHCLLSCNDPRTSVGMGDNKKII